MVMNSIMPNMHRMEKSPSSKLERFLIATLLIILIWAPLPLGSNRDWSVGLLIMLVSFSAFVWALLLLKRPNRNQPSIKLGLAMFSLLVLTQVWVALQFAFGWTANSGATFQYLMLGIAYSLFFIMIFSLFNNRKRLVWLLGVLIVSGTFQAFYGASIALTGFDIFTAQSGIRGTSASGTFINHNHFAGYLEMTIAVGIGLILALRKGGEITWLSTLELLLSAKVLIRLAVVVMVIGLVMSHSRMGNSAFFVSLILIASLFILTNKEKRVRNTLILSSFIIIDVFIISQYFGLEKLKERLGATEVTITEENGQLIFDVNDLRGLALKNGLPLAMQKPIVGQGAGSYEATFIGYTGPNFGGHFDHAHNDFLELWIERGLMGVAPMVLFVMLALFFGLKAMLKGQSNFRKGVSFGASMGIVSILIHSFTDFNLHIPANALLFTTLCAIAVMAYTHPSPRRIHRREI